MQYFYFRSIIKQSDIYTTLIHTFIMDKLIRIAKRLMPKYLALLNCPISIEGILGDLTEPMQEQDI